jgi:hypothetical protein
VLLGSTFIDAIISLLKLSFRLNPILQIMAIAGTTREKQCVRSLFDFFSGRNSLHHLFILVHLNGFRDRSF